MPNTELGPWLCLGGSLLAVIAYELALFARERRQPECTARSIHAAVRVRWVEALSQHPGSEIVAVQTLRNSLMSATISASTAAVALMGALTLSVSALARGVKTSDRAVAFVPEIAIDLLLLAILFASYVCSSLAMRYFNHAGFVMSLPVGSEPRAALEPLAGVYVRRGGVLYSWGLRLFLFVTPLVAGLLNVYAMPFASLGLLLALKIFDSVPRLAPGENPGDARGDGR